MSNTKLKTKNLKLKTERGVSLYFAIAVMAILLAIGFGLSTIIISQMRMIKEMGDSVIALQAADTGIERAIYALYKEGTPLPFNYSGYLDLNQNGIQDPKEPTYQVDGLSPGPNCQGDYYCLKSLGNFEETTRAIEASY